MRIIITHFYNNNIFRSSNNRSGLLRKELLSDSLDDDTVHLLTLKKYMPTRWSATYELLERYSALQKQLDANHRELGIFPLTPEETALLNQAIKELKQFNLVTKELQDPTCTIAFARILFDTTRELCPQLDHYLSPTYTGHHNPDANRTVAFISAVCKIQNRCIDTLTPIEKELLDRAVVVHKEIINIDDNAAVVHETNDVIADFDILSEARKKRPKLKSDELAQYEIYGSLLHIVPTSNDAERLFSQCKLVLTDHRRSMHPKTFEQVMMLKINSDLWNMDTVSEVCYQNKIESMMMERVREERVDESYLRVGGGFGAAEEKKVEIDDDDEEDDDDQN